MICWPEDDPADTQGRNHTSWWRSHRARQLGRSECYNSLADQEQGLGNGSCGRHMKGLVMTGVKGMPTMIAHSTSNPVPARSLLLPGPMQVGGPELVPPWTSCTDHSPPGFPPSLAHAGLLTFQQFDRGNNLQRSKRKRRQMGPVLLVCVSSLTLTKESL